MFNQVNDKARAFVREIKDNEVFRLVRSEAQFKKFAEAEGIDLKSARGNIEGALKKRIAVWSKKAGHGIIANAADYKKFQKITEEVEAPKEPAKRGPKPKGDTESKPKVRGPKAAKEVTEPVKRKRSRSYDEVSDVDTEVEKVVSTVSSEPDLELDVDSGYEERHNLKEFSKAFKSELKRLGVASSVNHDDLIKVLRESENVRTLACYVMGVFKLKYEIPKNI